MKRVAAIGMIVACTLLLCKAPSRADGDRMAGVRTVAANEMAMSAVELKVIQEMNRARANPRQYAEELQKFRARFQGTIIVEADGTRMQTQEGVAAVDDAIRFLQSQAALSAFAPSEGLASAARDMVAGQGPTGAIGHTAPDGSQPGARIARYGAFEGSWGENISYGYSKAQAIVMQLVIDDGVPNRGHRTNIFNPQFKCVGVAVGPHQRYRSMCVMDFAGGFVPK